MSTGRSNAFNIGGVTYTRARQTNATASVVRNLKGFKGSSMTMFSPTAVPAFNPGGFTPKVEHSEEKEGANDENKLESAIKEVVENCMFHLVRVDTAKREVALPNREMIYFSEEFKKASCALYPDVATDKFLVPRNVEELYMHKDHRHGDPRCCNGLAKCEAARLCKQKNLKPYVLPAFAPPIRGYVKDRRCVLCIRKDCKLAIVASRLMGIPISAKIFPYRNSAGAPGEYKQLSCATFSAAEKRAGCNFFFVYHDDDFYIVTENAIFHNNAIVQKWSE
jgi:hypothetical protein